MSDINEAVTKHFESKREIFAHCNVSEKDRTPDPLEDHRDQPWLYFKSGDEYREEIISGPHKGKQLTMYLVHCCTGEDVWMVFANDKMMEDGDG